MSALQDTASSRTDPKRDHVVSHFQILPAKTYIDNCSEVLTKYACSVPSSCPSLNEVKQYFGVTLCVLLLWGSSWFLLKEIVLPGGYLFNMVTVVITGYIFGHTLERYTSLHPVVGMTVFGVLFRQCCEHNFLEHPVADSIDFHLRRIYPVIILTRGPLTWSWEYIRRKSMSVFSLATIPWIAECLSTAVAVHVLLGFNWYWGIHLGAILSSVSPAVVVPICSSLHSKGFGADHEIALLVANAGGLDTAFTEGMFGVINTAIFYQAPLAYRIAKTALSIFMGIIIGILWGIIIDYIPDHYDQYAATIKSLLIFAGGLFLSYLGSYVGWGGVSGVAIMVCAGTAATRWSRRGWPVNENPVAEVYKLLWRIFEPMLFTLSGYYLDISSLSSAEFWNIVCCISLALIVRMFTAFLVSMANELTIKESAFIAITWIPKAIVEAVLVRVASDSIALDNSMPSEHDKKIAKLHSNIIVIAIVITSTLGSGLTNILGPILLHQESHVTQESYVQENIAKEQSSKYNREIPSSF